MCIFGIVFLLHESVVDAKTKLSSLYFLNLEIVVSHDMSAKLNTIPTKKEVDTIIFIKRGGWGYKCY